MDYGFYGSMMTVVMLIAFIGIALWAWSDKRRATFEDAARVPFQEDAVPDAHDVRDKA